MRGQDRCAPTHGVGIEKRSEARSIAANTTGSFLKPGLYASSVHSLTHYDRNERTDIDLVERASQGNQVTQVGHRLFTETGKLLRRLRCFPAPRGRQPAR